MRYRLSVNSFTNEANKLAFDLTGDNEKELKSQKRMKIWDKKRKKMVGVAVSIIIIIF